MEPRNLRLQEYRLALIFFRASRLIAFNKQTHKTDRPQLIYDLFLYCYYRYLSFDMSLSVSERNNYGINSLTAKSRIVDYLSSNSSKGTMCKVCDIAFGEGGWFVNSPIHTSYDIE